MKTILSNNTNDSSENEWSPNEDDGRQTDYFSAVAGSNTVEIAEAMEKRHDNNINNPSNYSSIVDELSGSDDQFPWGSPAEDNADPEFVISKSKIDFLDDSDEENTENDVENTTEDTTSMSTEQVGFERSIKYDHTSTTMSSDDRYMEAPLNNQECLPHTNEGNLVGLSEDFSLSKESKAQEIDFSNSELEQEELKMVGPEFHPGLADSNDTSGAIGEKVVPQMFNTDRMDGTSIFSDTENNRCDNPQSAGSLCFTTHIPHENQGSSHLFDEDSSDIFNSDRESEEGRTITNQEVVGSIENNRIFSSSTDDRNVCEDKSNSGIGANLLDKYSCSDVVDNNPQIVTEKAISGNSSQQERKTAPYTTKSSTSCNNDTSPFSDKHKSQVDVLGRSFGLKFDDSLISEHNDPNSEVKSAFKDNPYEIVIRIPKTELLNLIDGCHDHWEVWNCLLEQVQCEESVKQEILNKLEHLSIGTNSKGDVPDAQYTPNSSSVDPVTQQMDNGSIGFDYSDYEKSTVDDDLASGSGKCQISLDDKEKYIDEELDYKDRECMNKVNPDGISASLAFDNKKNFYNLASSSSNESMNYSVSDLSNIKSEENWNDHAGIKDESPNIRDGSKRAFVPNNTSDAAEIVSNEKSELMKKEFNSSTPSFKKSKGIDESNTKPYKQTYSKSFADIFDLQKGASVSDIEVEEDDDGKPLNIFEEEANRSVLGSILGMFKKKTVEKEEPLKIYKKQEIQKPSKEKIVNRGEYAGKKESSIVIPGAKTRKAPTTASSGTKVPNAVDLPQINKHKQIQVSNRTSVSSKELPKNPHSNAVESHEDKEESTKSNI